MILLKERDSVANLEVFWQNGILSERIDPKPLICVFIRHLPPLHITQHSPVHIVTSNLTWCWWRNCLKETRAMGAASGFPILQTSVTKWLSAVKFLNYIWHVWMYMYVCLCMVGHVWSGDNISESVLHVCTGVCAEGGGVSYSYLTGP